MAVETPTPAPNGLNVYFNALHTISDEQLFVDRILQVPGTDYTVSGTQITFLAGAVPPAGAFIRLYYPGAATAGSATAAGYEAASSIINDVAVELGLAESTDPFNDPNPNFVQLCRLLKSAGRDLVHEFQWPHLIKEYQFTTVTGQFYYPLPADFHEMIDQTGWNRTTRLPMGGPISPQEWQYLSARLSSVIFTVLFRPQQQMMHLYPANGNLTGGQTMAYEYMSKSWVAQTAATTVWTPSTAYTAGQSIYANGNTYLCTTSGTSAGSGGPSGYANAITDGSVVWTIQAQGLIANTDAPTSSNDILWFDSLLLLRRLKLDWLKLKGLDTTHAKRAYDDVLEKTINSVYAAPVLNLRGRQSFDPLLGIQSIPITGYG